MNSKRKLISNTATLLFVLLTVSIKAQDIHFSQYDANPVILNPSYTGMSDDINLRVCSQFRNQWSTSGSSFTSTTLGFDTKYDNFGFGGYLINDNSAFVINSFNMVAAGAYRITDPKKEELKLTVGLSAGFIYKSTKKDKLTFDNQYNNGTFDPDKPSGEVFNKNSVFMPDINFGFSYSGQYNRGKIVPFAGFTLFHITNPKESLLATGSARLPMRIVYNMGSSFYVIDNVTIEPKFLFMAQGKSREMNFGLGGSYLFDSRNNIVFSGGVYYRNKDAAIINLGFEYKSILYQFSYDINTSPLKQFTKSRGSLEFGITFIDRGKAKRGGGNRRK